jgi:hypothetical protein
MPIRDDIAAIRADNNRTERQKSLDIYQLKNAALLDVLWNGKPSPQPIPPVVGREFTLDGTTIRVNTASLVLRMATDGQLVEGLFIDVTLTRGPITVTHQVHYYNPPVIPGSPTGNERQDLIAAASEMIAALPVG